MATIGLGFTLSANATGLASGAASAAAALDKIGTAAKRTARDVGFIKNVEIGRMMGSGLGMAANAFSSAGMSATGFVSGVTDALDATNDLSERIGVGVEALQSLQMAGKLSGVDDMTGSMQKLAVSIGKAADSGNIGAFTKLGIDFQKFQAMKPEDQFRAVARAIAALPTEADRAAAAVEVFGKSGVELLPLFAKNIDDVEKQMRRLGGVVSAEGVEAIGQMNDALDLVKASMGGIIGQVAGNLAPAVTALAEEFKTFVGGFNGEGGTGLADSITVALFEGADALASTFDHFADYFGEWMGSFDSFGQTMQSSAASFATIGDVFVGVGETMRYAFNTFEIVGNNISIGLGKFIETAGWLFRDKTAQDFGKAMAEAAAADLEENKQQMQDAKQNAGQAFGNALFGPGQQLRAAAEGPGMAARAVATAREAFDNRNNPEAMLRRQMEKAKRDAERAAAADKAAKEREAAKKAAADEKIYAASEFKRETEKALGTRASQALKTGDIRSSEGINAYMALATGREDPAIAEYRKQTEKLQRLIQAVEGQNNAPAVILGGAEG